jgi:hypothetical protein
MLNFNSLNKTEKDIILSHNAPYKNLMTAIRDDNDKLFNLHHKDADLSIDGCMLLKYAAMKGRKRMLRVMLNRTLLVDRPTLLTSILTGGHLELLELFGDICPENDLSPESLAICAQNGYDQLFDELFDAASEEYKSKYSLVSIAIRGGSFNIARKLIESDYEFNEYDAILTACASNSAEFLTLIIENIEYIEDDNDLAFLDGAIIAATYGNTEVLRCLFDTVFPEYIDDKNNAIIKAAVFSHDIDTVNLVISTGCELDFDDGILLPIAAGLEGKGEKPTGYLDMFKLILDKSGIPLDTRDDLALKTAEAYARTDIIEFIKTLTSK